MRWPKCRELKEAVIAVFSPRFTTRYPAVPCEVPERYRGKPEFDNDLCVGCGACVNVCPTLALTQVDDLEAEVYMAVGELEGPMVTNVHNLAQALRDREYASLELQTTIFDDEDHASVIPAIMTRGLRTVYHEEGQT